MRNTVRDLCTFLCSCNKVSLLEEGVQHKKLGENVQNEFAVRFLVACSRYCRPILLLDDEERGIFSTHGPPATVVVAL